MSTYEMYFPSDHDRDLKSSLALRREDMGSSPIDTLRLQLVTITVPQDLAKIKDTLLSIIHILKPDRKEKQNTIFSFISRVIDLSMNIILLLEAMEELRHATIERLLQVLGDVRTFIVSADQWELYPCSVDALRKVLFAKSRILELRISSILDGLERSFSNTQIESPMGESSYQFTQNASNLFPNASNFTVNNSQFYSISGGSVHLIPQIAEGHPDFLGLPYYEDLELETELYKARDYRLHRGRARGRAVIVKVFQGPRAKQLCLKTAEFNRSVMHPNVLQMIAGPNRNSGSSFLVFDGDYQGTVESQLPMVLKAGINEGCVIGLNTVIACSLGLDYLHEFGVPFSILEPKHFVLMVSNQGKIVLDFDADALWVHVAGILSPDHSENGQSDKATKVCNELIQKTFYVSCKEHYQDQRVYEDDGGEEDQAFLENEDVLNKPGDETESRPRPEPDGPRRDSKGQKAPRNYRGHRRELVWKPWLGTPCSLQEIGQQYQMYLTRLRSEDVWVQRRGYSAKQVAHRCPGYKRTEIVLTQDIKRSGILSHTSPIPNEICSVCGEKVSIGEIFDCRCGLREKNEDDSQPTIKCTVCSLWEHQECVDISPGAQMKSFACWRCTGSIPSSKKSCIFFKAGKCTAGSSCPFSHSTAELGEKKVCPWFMRGICKLDHKCPFAHNLPGQSLALDRKNKKAARYAAAISSASSPGRIEREPESVNSNQSFFNDNNVGSMPQIVRPERRDSYEIEVQPPSRPLSPLILDEPSMYGSFLSPNHAPIPLPESHPWSGNNIPTRPINPVVITGALPLGFVPQLLENFLDEDNVELMSWIYGPERSDSWELNLQPPSPPDEPDDSDLCLSPDDSAIPLPRLPSIRPITPVVITGALPPGFVPKSLEDFPNADNVGSRRRIDKSGRRNSWEVEIEPPSRSPSPSSPDEQYNSWLSPNFRSAIPLPESPSWSGNYIRPGTPVEITGALPPGFVPQLLIDHDGPTTPIHSPVPMPVPTVPILDDEVFALNTRLKTALDAIMGK